MLPKTGNILEHDFVIMRQPSKTFRLDIDNGRILGMVDGIESIKQAVYCILNTERFEWLIYSWNYGIELKELFGSSMSVAKSKIKKRMKEALMQDERIQSIDAFSFSQNRNKLAVTFTVHTWQGDFTAEKEVQI